MILDSAKEVWDKSEMMVKVKEPLKEEYQYFHEGLILYTYLHLAADRPLTDALLASKVKGVAYETLIERNGSLPLLAPMSQIAGRSVSRKEQNIWRNRSEVPVFCSPVYRVHQKPMLSFWEAAMLVPMPARSLWEWART